MNVAVWAADVASQTADSSAVSFEPPSSFRAHRYQKPEHRAPRPRLAREVRASGARTPFGAISTNSLLMPAVTATEGRSPKRARTRDIQEQEEIVPEHQSREHTPETVAVRVEEDADATPRVIPKPSLFSAGGPSLSHQVPPNQRQTPDDDGASSTRSSSPSKRSTVTSHSRKSSPSKPSSLRNLRQPIQQRFLDPAADAPEGLAGLAELWTTLEDVSSGQRILPARCRDGVQSLGRAFRTQEQLYDNSGYRDTLGSLPGMSFIQDIIIDSQECAEDAADESSWNAFVHGPLLKTAIRHSTRRQAVSIKGVMDRKISPITLLPAGAASHKVDFAAVLSSRSHPQYHSRRLDLNGSFNALDEDAIASSPMVLGIETKPEGEGGNKGGTQLSVWAGAQLNRLRGIQQALGQPASSLAPLPLLLVQGSTWYFQVATMADDGGSIAIWHLPGSLGSTESSKGVYQIVMALQVIADWMCTRWSPWFDKHVLGLAS